MRHTVLCLIVGLAILSLLRDGRYAFAYNNGYAGCFYFAAEVTGHNCVVTDTNNCTGYSQQLSNVLVAGQYPTSSEYHFICWASQDWAGSKSGEIEYDCNNLNAFRQDTSIFVLGVKFQESCQIVFYACGHQTSISVPYPLTTYTITDAPCYMHGGCYGIGCPP